MSLYLNRRNSTDNFIEWSDKEKQQYWDKKEEERKAEEERLRNFHPVGDGGIGLSDNDGW